MSFTVEDLRSRLHYNQDTGLFTWIKPLCSIRKPGDVAGSTKHKDGYAEIGIFGKLFLSHRLAWFYVHGAWPDGQVDHINGDRLDNRISNLRIATHGQNRANSRAGKNNLLGVKGVFKTRSGKFVAQIRAGKKQRHIGTFLTVKEASEAYRKAAEKYHGEFARTA